MANNQHTPKRQAVKISDTVAGIPLTKGYTALVDAELAPFLSQWNWSARETSNKTYATRTTKGARATSSHVQMHRVVLSLTLKRDLLTTEQVDHKNLDGLDNRSANLRLATVVQNAQNKRTRSDNTSGYKGVSRHSTSKGWRARIVVDKKTIHLGLFSTPKAAYAAYCEAATKYHGEFMQVK